MSLVLKVSLRIEPHNRTRMCASMKARISSLLAVLVGSSVAIAQETKVAKKDLPAAVQKAVDEQAKGAVVRGFTKEVEDGKTEYEAELRINGHSKDISFDPDGNI